MSDLSSNLSPQSSRSFTGVPGLLSFVPRRALQRANRLEHAT